MELISTPEYIPTDGCLMFEEQKKDGNIYFYFYFFPIFLSDTYRCFHIGLLVQFSY